MVNILVILLYLIILITVTIRRPSRTPQFADKKLPIVITPYQEVRSAYREYAREPEEAKKKLEECNHYFKKAVLELTLEILQENMEMPKNIMQYATYLTLRDQKLKIIFPTDVQARKQTKGKIDLMDTWLFRGRTFSNEREMLQEYTYTTD
jgi:hypothetical protein